MTGLQAIELAQSGNVTPEWLALWAVAGALGAVAVIAAVAHNRFRSRERQQQLIASKFDGRAEVYYITWQWSLPQSDIRGIAWQRDYVEGRARATGMYFISPAGSGMIVIGIVVSLGLPLPILVLVRVSWAWSARHRLLSVQRRRGWLRSRLARAEMVWVHTADLGLPPQQVDHEARAHGFVVARALVAPDGHAMLLSREAVPRLAGDGRRGLDGLLATVAGTALGALVTMVLASFPRDDLDLTILAMTIGLTAAIMSGVALWIFGRWAGSRSRRVGQVLREFQQPRPS